jgi:hypothetical protein
MNISKLIARIVYPVIESVLDMYYSNRVTGVEIHPGDSIEYAER